MKITYNEITAVKSEAIKEFAERLKACLDVESFNTPDERWRSESEFAQYIDGLANKMTEENKK